MLYFHTGYIYMHLLQGLKAKIPSHNILRLLFEKGSQPYMVPNTPSLLTTLPFIESVEKLGGLFTIDHEVVNCEAGCMLLQSYVSNHLLVLLVI